MKTKILIAASLAALVVPAASFGSGPTGQDRENGARACRALRASLGEDLFRSTYGTGPKHRNAFGKCVSSKAKTASDQQKSNTLNAARSCKAERSSMEGPAFRAKYGKNANDRNAFGKCVSQLSKSTT